MLERILGIRGVGLIRDQGKSPEFKRLTLIFGENAKGKSTLAAVLRACGDGDVSPVAARNSLGYEGPQEVHLLFRTPGNVANCKYSSDGWSEPFPNLEVFDAEFVDRNVYSGMAVDPRQRQQLLDFILGDAPVAIRKQIDDCDSRSRSASQAKTKAQDALKGYAGPYSVSQFSVLVADADLNVKSDRAKQHVQDLKNASNLLARNPPVALGGTDFLVEELFERLGTTISGLQSRAEELMRGHIGNRAPTMEGWLSDGLQYCLNSDCPYCGSELGPGSLLDAYRSCFDQAYIELKDSLTDFSDRLAKRLDPQVVEKLAAASAANTDKVLAWQPQVTTEPPEFDKARFEAALDKLRATVVPLIERKLASPLEPIDTLDQATILGQVETLRAVVGTYNEQLKAAVAPINEFKGRLVSGNVPDAQRQVERYEAQSKLTLKPVRENIDLFVRSTAEHLGLNKEKADLQSQLRALAPSLIKPYVDAMNSLLRAFGADFTIIDPAHTNAGGRPTIEYKLRVANTTVDLGNREAIHFGPGFSSVLSESDKRTLALCFFLAKLDKDPNLSDKVVVIDDPISSFDRNRQRQTCTKLIALANSCRQLVVLSHDPRFLDALRRQWQRSQRGGAAQPHAEMEIARTGSGSRLRECSVQRLALSGLPEKRRRLLDYIGGAIEEPTEMAGLVIEVLEGYIKFKYPAAIKEDWSLGSILNDLATLPAAIATNVGKFKQELRALNDTISPLRHGGNADEVLGVTDAEAREWALEAERIILEGL